MHPFVHIFGTSDHHFRRFLDCRLHPLDYAANPVGRKAEIDSCHLPAKFVSLASFLKVVKILIILFLSCWSVVAADTGVRVSSNVRTNAETGAIYIQDTYTRHGQTNLVRITKIQGGVVVFRLQKFCHDGQEVAYFSERPPNTPLTFTVKAKCPYEVELDYLPNNKDVRCLIIWGGNFFDGFFPANGIYYPVSDADLDIRSDDQTNKSAASPAVRH